MSTLTSAMWSGVSGLTAHSQGITVIGNNLANTSTTGYKSASITFEDVFYSTVGTANGNSQVGNGVAVSSIYQDFSSGSFQSSTSTTDLAIDGEGFFMVSDPNTNEVYYTRSGNFSFNEDGYLINKAGYRVQGWDIGEESTSGRVTTSGVLGDLVLKSYQCSPQATTLVSTLVNLDNKTKGEATSATNPFFAMAEQWDGTAKEALTDSDYAYQTTLTVYDEAGTGHTLTVYFDPVDESSVTSGSGGDTAWEFIVTCDPDDDGRTINGQTLAGTSNAGLLMTGTLSFDSSGELTGLSAYTLSSNASGDLSDLSNWTPASVDEDGYPVCTPNFSGSADASVASGENALNIGINLGISSNYGNENYPWNATGVTAADVGTDMANVVNFASPSIDVNASTSYDASSSTINRTQNGYAAGFLEDLEIDSNGVVTGNFSNGQTIDLFVIGLATFVNENGLSQEGANLYAQTEESGLATTGVANTTQLGSIKSYTLEASNVDLSTEMVELISLQRGYQSNSKVITTVDTLLSEALNLKR